MAAFKPGSDGQGAEASLSLEGFDLLEPIGYGGVAQVWLGRHRRLGTEVAVKVVTGRPARDPVFVRGFHREIQTIAALDHPCVVLLLDHGKVPAEVAQRSGGRLDAGSPYLVMELSRGGTLSQAIGERGVPWPLIRQVLVALLDALSHAHARGVIHRDIKPDNVLRFPDTPALWRLTDFGIAHVVGERGPDGDSVLGTPGYMAPEQVRGEHRDYGPWTDLYSLGALAYQLIWGRLPYPYAEVPRYIYAQMEHPAPRAPLPPGMPPGLDVWVHRLLERDPLQRYRWAADAAWALCRLDAAATTDSLEGSNDLWAGMQTREIPAMRPVDLAELPTERHPLMEGEMPTWSSPGLPVDDPAPPMPDSWRSVAGGRASAVIEAGVRLYGLRNIPLVGRVRERDLLWGSLKEVSRTGRAQAVFIQGGEGVGKSRMIEWLAERAHEVGAATVLEATYADERNPGGVAAAMLERYFRCEGLDRAQTRARVERSLGRLGVVASAEIDVLVDLMAEASPRPEGDAGSGPETRFAVLRRMLQLVGRDRPVMLCFDDAHTSPEVVAFTRYLLAERGQRDAPVLMVASQRLPSEEERPDSANDSQALFELEGVTPLELAPLSDQEQTRLVRELLGLKGELVEMVVSWSGGNPLAAVQLIGSWVRRGLLKPGRGGFELDGQMPALPPSLHRVLGERLDRVLAERAVGDRLALELGAAMGHEVDADLWQQLCAQEGLDPSVDLIEALVERRLARWKEQGWSFVHEALRQLLEAGARAAGRWQAHHLACARLYSGVEDPSGRRAIKSRLALHRVEGGQPLEALDPLFEAAEQRWFCGDFLACKLLLERAETLLRRLVPSEESGHWQRLWLQRSRLSMAVGRYEESVALAQRVRTRAQLSDDTALLAEATQVMALAHFRQGSYDLALPLYQEAVRRFEDLGQGVALGSALLGLGEVGRRKGDAHLARSYYARALGRFRAEGHPAGMAHTFGCMAALAQGREPLKAREFYRRAIALHTQVGNRAQVQACINGLADIDRARGRLDEAEAKYREVLGFHEATGSAAARIVRTNLALVLLARGRYVEAEALLQQVKAALERDAQVDILGGVLLDLALCAAARGDWPSYDADLARAQEILDYTGVVDRDDAWPAQQAGDLAAAAGEAARARPMYLLSARLWGALGEQGRLAQVKAALFALPLS